jgi:signal transduction histidine kinase
VDATSARSRAAWLGGALLTLVLLAGFAFVLVQSQERSRRELEHRFTLRASLAARFVQTYVKELADLERRQASRDLAGATVSETDFRRFVGSFGFEAAVLLDDEGRALHVYPSRPALRGVNLAERYAHLRNALRGDVGVSSVVPSAARGVPIVAVAVQYGDPGRRRIFSGAFEPASAPIASYLRSVLPIAGSRLTVTDDAGSLVVGTPRAAEKEAELFVAEQELTGIPWRVTASVPEASLFEPVSGWTRWVPWLVFAAFALAAAIVLVAVRRLGQQRAALARRNVELQKLDRLKDELIALVSHELRTPLTSIHGYLDLVLEGRSGDLTAEQREFLAIVRRSADRLLALVNDLLFLAQAEAGMLKITREPADLVALAEESLQGARPSADAAGVELELDAPESLAADVDGSRVVQLLDNLVSNAIKFTPSGGHVCVRVARRADRASIVVSDTGMGISAEDQARIFSRFFRTAEAGHEAIQGTGLGLTITKTIAEAHGGSISVASEPGRGTRFTVEIPTGAGRQVRERTLQEVAA